MSVIHMCCLFIGIEIMGLPEPFSGAENAKDIWDSVCMEIITSSLVTGEHPLQTCPDLNVVEIFNVSQFSCFQWLCN